MELNEKQVHILKVAEKLFAENGFDGTSVRQIAKEAGINIAMISYYFGSKEKMLDALLFHRFAGFRKEMDKVMSEEGGYHEKIDHMIAFMIRRIHDNRRAYKVVNFEYSNPVRQVSFERYISQKIENYKLVETLIRNGQEAGVFASDINIALIIPTVLGTYFHFYYNKKFFLALLQISGEDAIDDYVYTTLTAHIQQTVKALLSSGSP
ncbi:TetR/AcrR family transcriptional regulator [Sinomicrobium soli]|uniref:TetR/AcrR family transcriptional regulator n=1 Tax=Sinomicrobium sp. N-1-3-6 TaxID=2219864 RepID=UPI000DCC2A46|nr:TetR family transcriptional regulator [Sinomicrobium sp. N-1-3-6]RAV30630.1 TetR/AcrR family transcriptional regulator [Sinomicrobium sp. N-1-3-6]